jgi:hypothetical protein
VLRVNVFDALETLDEALAAREEVAIHEQVVLTLVGAGIIEHRIDELAGRGGRGWSAGVNRAYGEDTKRQPHLCAIGVHSVGDERVDHVRDGVGRKLLIAQGVEDGQPELVGFRDGGVGQERQDTLRGVRAVRSDIANSVSGRAFL